MIVLAWPRPATRVQADEGGLRVVGADEVVLSLSAATSFNGFDHSPVLLGKNPAALSAQTLAAAQARSFEELLHAHLADYQPLFQRVDLKLGDRLPPPLPTDLRIATFQQDHDPTFVELLFHYGH